MPHNQTFVTLPPFAHFNRDGLLGRRMAARALARPSCANGQAGSPCDTRQSGATLAANARPTAKQLASAPHAQPRLNAPAPWRRIAAIALATAALSACSTPDVDLYRAEQPTLDLRRYFNGPLQAHGMFQDRSGEIVKRFHVDIVGSWQGNKGTLDERFTYSDGSREQRIWHLEVDEQGQVTGRADDVVGQASGRIAGNTMRWQYTLALPVDGRIVNVQFDDWLVLMDQQVMLNRATMSKWGFKLGEVTLSFTKGAPQPEASARGDGAPPK